MRRWVLNVLIVNARVNGTNENEFFLNDEKRARFLVHER